MKFLNFFNDANQAALLINIEDIKLIQNEKANPTNVIVRWRDNTETKLIFGTFEAVKEFITAVLANS
jgi:hypothetical protein